MSSSEIIIKDHEEVSGYIEKKLIKLCGTFNLNWIKMDKEEKIKFIDDMIYEVKRAHLLY